jgi:hypothetical protein
MFTFTYGISADVTTSDYRKGQCNWTVGRRQGPSRMSHGALRSTFLEAAITRPMPRNAMERRPLREALYITHSGTPTYSGSPMVMPPVERNGHHM